MHNLIPLNPFPLSRDERIKALLNYITSALHKPMTPAEFCQKWVDYPLTEQDYAEACESELITATG